MKWEKLLQSLSWNNFTLGSLVLIFLFIYLFIYWPYTILFTLYCCNFFFFLCKTEKHNKIYKKNRWFVDISYIWLWSRLLVCCVLRLLRYSLTENCTRSKLKSSLMISCPLEVRTLARIACLGNRYIMSFLKHFLDRPV